MVSAEDHKHRNTLTLIPTSSLASGPLIKYNLNETAGLKNSFTSDKVCYLAHNVHCFDFSPFIENKQIKARAVFKL